MTQLHPVYQVAMWLDLQLINCLSCIGFPLLQEESQGRSQLQRDEGLTWGLMGPGPQGQGWGSLGGFHVALDYIPPDNRDRKPLQAD